MAKNTEEEIVVAEARMIVASHERKEAMEAALDIVATTTKQQAQHAVREAEKAQNAAEHAQNLAYEAWHTALKDYAPMALAALPLTQKIIDVIHAMTEEEIQPDEAWEYIRATYDAKGVYWVTGTPVVSFGIHRKEGYTTATIESGDVTVELDMSEQNKILSLRSALDNSVEAHKAAKKVTAAARERLANHKDLVAVSRVQMQRHKLSTMGAEGGAVLERVEQLLAAASNDESYLGLL